MSWESFLGFPYKSHQTSFYLLKFTKTPQVYIKYSCTESLNYILWLDTVQDLTDIFTFHVELSRT